MAIVGAVVVTALVTVLLTDGDDPATTPSPSASSTPAQPTTTPPASDPSRIEVERRVEVNGTTVTVDERYTVQQGAEVVLAPQTVAGEPTLQLQALRTVAQDGTEAAFTDPVTVSLGRSLATRGVYRLRYCPDIISLAWPSTASVTGADYAVDVVRSDEPLRTAAAICPAARSDAKQEQQLRATVKKSGPRTATLTLTWSGKRDLTVVAIGAPSGLPLDGVGRPCGSECVADVRPGRKSRVELRPVEGCPRPAAASDRLPLLLNTSGQRTVRWVSAPGLGRWFAGACSG